ncbi:MAG: hypothetical protein ABII00_16120 [Elusimicrobiota bacterium]
MTRRPLIPLLLAAALVCAAAPARSETLLAQYAKDKAPGVEGAPSGDALQGLLPPDAELIDVPTAAVLDLGGFYSKTRFFAQGGLLEWLNFGIYPRVNLGASFNIDKMVGTGSPVQITRPELQLKLRFYDGDRVIPAFALGFDGQGYFYNRTVKRYNHKQRGLYVVGSQEVGVPGLEFHAGMNISDFDSNSLFGIIAASLNVQDKLKLMVEWDNINDFFDSRFNTGLRIHMTPHFNLGFSVRAIGQGGDFSNGVPRSTERVVQFKYTGNF